MSGIAGGLSSGVELLLRILEDPGKLKLKLDEFRSAAKEADGLIALAGPASEIPKLREQLERELNEAKAAHLKANEEASKLVSDALNAAKKVRAGAQAELEDARAEAHRVRNEAQAALTSCHTERSQLAKERGEVEAGLTKLRNLDETLRSRELALNAREAELEAERERLMKIAQRFQAEVA